MQTKTTKQTKTKILKEQKQVINEMGKIFKIFKNSEDNNIRPHFILTGSSGSGKSYSIKLLADHFDLNYIEVNAAALTKEGTSGNSLSKALAPLKDKVSATICFVDEFDKLFISGNSNSSVAHEITNGVQNEFLKVLENNEIAVFGDYGKYPIIDVSDVLFVFAGAFNGEKNITLDRLRDFGLKTEFLGRVSLIYNIKKPSLDSMLQIVDENDLFLNYSNLFQLNKEKKEEVSNIIKDFIKENYEKNTIGVRYINTLIHQYFIKGGLIEEDVKKISFQKTLNLNDKDFEDEDEDFK